MMNDTDFIEHYGMSKEDAITHYGVPGMKWGKRKAADSGSTLSPRAERKAARKRANEERDNTILTARKNLASSQAKVEAAGQNYERAKNTKGEKAARRALEKAGQEMLANDINSQQATSKELGQASVGFALAALGSFTIAAAIAAANSSR